MNIKDFKVSFFLDGELERLFFTIAKNVSLMALLNMQRGFMLPILMGIQLFFCTQENIRATTGVASFWQATLFLLSRNPILNDPANYPRKQGFYQFLNASSPNLSLPEWHSGVGSKGGKK